MRSYSISHAVLGVTYVAVHQDNPRECPSVIRLVSSEDKEKFLLSTLQEGDKLYCEYILRFSDQRVIYKYRTKDSILRIHLSLNNMTPIGYIVS